MHLKSTNHIVSIHIQRCWLPIPERIQYKILLLNFRPFWPCLFNFVIKALNLSYSPLI